MPGPNSAGSECLLLNGTIHTLDPSRPTVQAVAVRDGRIIAVGSTEQIRALGHDGMRSIELQGRTVIPGIFDSHIHVLEMGLKLTQIRLDECQSPEEMMELVRQRAADTPPGSWIVGQGWNEEKFPDRRPPTRHDLDPATDRHPVLLQRFFNTDVVNTMALQMAGIDRSTADPAGGRIEREADGTPNGLLRAAAKQLVRPLVPKPSVDEMVHALDLAQRELHRFGITSALDPGLYPAEMSAYQEAYRRGGLRLRMNIMPSWHGFRDDEHEEHLTYRAAELGISSGLGDEWLRLGGLKMAVDGGTTPHTAWMYEPFVGEATIGDFNRLSLDELHRYFRTAQELRWDVGIHTCGDRAQDLVAETFAAVAAEVSWADARHNIIHAYFPTPTALEQMATHSIGAVVQPTFLYWEGNAIFNDVGEERANNYKPVRTYLDQGIPVSASSDIPSTVSPDPFTGIYALVTRKNNVGRVVAPHEAISREEALRCYTLNGTWLTREESVKGSIEAGKVADLVVLDRDLFAVEEEEIKEIKVEMTMLGGEITWEQNNA